MSNGFYLAVKRRNTNSFISAHKRHADGQELENNNTVGEILSEVSTSAGNVTGFEFWSDCGGDSPEVSCECCTVCCPDEKGG
jgi:hypothetical protein